MKIWHCKGAWIAGNAQGKIADLEIADIKSLAVIKHGAFGDLVLTRPFFTSLRSWFPEARITISLISHYMNGAPRDLVDRVHVALGKDEKNRSFRRKLKSYRELGYHDILFDITASNASFWTTLVTPAKLKIGYIHRLHHRFLYDVAIPRSDYKFESETFLDQLFTLGINYPWPPDFGFSAGPPSSERSDIVYFPTASIADRCWPIEHFGRLMARLAEKVEDHDHMLLLGLQEWEQKAGESMARMVGERSNVRIIRDSRGDDTHRLVKNARMVISNDTGIRNLAIAMGTPTLGIFKNSLPFRYMPRFGNHEIAFDPAGGNPTVDDVFEKAMKLLGRREA